MPGTYGLVQIPSSVFPVFTSPLRKLILSGVLGEAFRRANRPENIKDESLDAFMTRRFGESFARTFGSALVHGIYAADSRKLSVRAAFPSLWTAEERGWGSVVRGMLMPSLPNFRRASDYDLGEASQILKNASVYSFMDGMQTLTDELEYYLSNQSNVGILRNTSVTLLQQKEDKSFEVSPLLMKLVSAEYFVKITLSSGTSVNPTHVVSTLPLPVLKTLLGPGQTILPHLTANPSSSVSVVDIIFPGPPSEIHPEGFGYLIPRPESDYSHSSPAILGTIFDSCSLQNRSTQLTRLTMMLGGPYPSRATENITLPFILRNLEEHLQRRLPQPVFWKVRQNENCIPVPTPGHLERMEEMRKVLKDQWDGRLKVIGAGVGGVSVGDCVEAGKRVGQSWNNT